MSVDPLAPEYPWYTPYQFAGNMPIWAIDLDGLEPLPISVYGEDFQNSFLQAHRNADFVMLEMEIVGYVALGGGLVVQLTKMTVKGASIFLVKEVAETAIETTTGVPVFTARDLAKMSKGFYDNFTGYLKKKVFSNFPCGCFTENTKVKTKEGYKDIEEIVVGDEVWAYDDSTSTKQLKEVTAIFEYRREGYYRLYSGTETLNVTSDHPFYISGEWREVKHIVAGDSLRLFTGLVSVVDSLVYVEEEVSVYNFTVDDYHTYFVGETEVLTHNSDPCDWIKRRADMGKWVDPANGKSFRPHELDGALNFEMLSNRKLKATTTGKGDFEDVLNGSILDHLGMGEGFKYVPRPKAIEQFKKSLDKHVKKLSNGVDELILDFKDFTDEEINDIKDYIKQNHSNFEDKINLING